MPKLEYFVVSESHAVDTSRNSVSVFHVLNIIPIANLPEAIHSLVAISGWIHDDQEIQLGRESQLRLQFEMPGANAPVEFRGNLRAESKHQYFNFWFTEIPIEQVGEATIRLFIDDNEAATHTLTFRMENED